MLGCWFSTSDRIKLWICRKTVPAVTQQRLHTELSTENKAMTSERIQIQHLLMVISVYLSLTEWCDFCLTVSHLCLPFIWTCFLLLLDVYIQPGRLSGNKQFSGCTVPPLTSVSLHVCECLQVCLPKCYAAELCVHFLIYVTNKILITIFILIKQFVCT